MPASRRARLSLAVLLALVNGAAGAQEDMNQQALVRAQSLLRQVSGQKQELEAANARLTAEVDALRKKLAVAESRLKEASVNLASEQRKVERAGLTAEQLERAETALRETDERLRRAAVDLRQRDSEAAELKARLARLEADLADSERKNLQLYQANVELLELYRKKGPLTALLQNEPVTGLKNIEIENVLQEYRLKLADSLTESSRRSITADGDPPGVGGTGDE